MAAPFGLGGTGARVAAMSRCLCPAVYAEPVFSLFIIRKDYSSPDTALFIDPLLINHSHLNIGVLGIWGFVVMG